jgi:predicted RNA-binding Zn-ribbon protein involved in translation (DUF1610 family)
MNGTQNERLERKAESGATPPPGTLKDVGVGTLGLAKYRYSACLTCGTEYPHLGPGPSCNGHQIHRCPWCRPDSQPWTHGRGR